MLADRTANLEIEPVECRFGERRFDSQFVDQAGHGCESRAVERVMPFAPAVLYRDQPGFGEQLEVLADGGTTDRLGSGQVDDSGRADGERAQELPAYRVGESGECIHQLLVTQKLPMCQGPSSSCSGDTAPLS